MTNHERDKLIEKVRKLVALAEGGATEHEAETALQLAHNMLAEHNLTLDDVKIENRDEIETLISDDVIERYNERWRRAIVSNVANLYFCHYYYTDAYVHGRNSNQPQRGIKHRIIGKSHNVQVAKLMSTYLIATVNRLANEGFIARSRYGQVGRTSTERGRYINSFRLSAAGRLAFRMQQIRKNAEKGLAHGSNGKNLPALQSVYDHEDMLYQEWLKKSGIEIVSKKSSAQITDVRGARDGVVAGDSINLGPQIGAKPTTTAVFERNSRPLITNGS